VTAKDEAIALAPCRSIELKLDFLREDLAEIGEILDVLELKMCELESSPIASGLDHATSSAPGRG
jgi:hypothetical protein